MGIRVDFSKFLKNADQFADLSKMQIRNAAKRAISRGMTNAVKLSTQELRKDYRLKASEIKERLTLARPRGKALEGMFWVSGRPISLSRFLVSPTSYVTQKGVPVRKRTPVRVRVSPRSGAIELKQGFLVNIGKEKLQIFRRTSASSKRTRAKGGTTHLPIRKMDVTSLAHTYESRDVFSRIRGDVEATLERSFNDALSYYVKKNAAE